MENTILSPAACEEENVIRFVQAEGNGAAHIHHRLCAVYGDSVTSDGSVRNWYVIRNQKLMFSVFKINIFHFRG